MVGYALRWQVPFVQLLEESGTLDDSKSEQLRDNLVREARRVEEDVLYSSKGQYAAAERWRNMHLWIGVPTAVLTGIAGALIVGGPAEMGGIPLDAVFGLVAIAGAVSTAVMTFLGPEKRSSAHQQAADEYNALKGRARRFCEIDAHKPICDNEISERLEALVRERDRLNGSSPLIPASAYAKAKRAVKEGQANYQADENNAPIRPDSGTS